VASLGRAADLIKPSLVTPGASVFADSFDDAKLGPAWHIRTGTWTIHDGCISGVKLATEPHPAKLELKQPWQDGILRFTFQLDQPSGLDLMLYQGEKRVLVVQLRSEALAFGLYPENGPSKARIVEQTSSGFAINVKHAVMIERRGGSFHIQADNGLSLQVNDTRLAPGFTSSLFTLHGDPPKTLTLDDVAILSAKLP
jgi:hypothetical protein